MTRWRIASSSSPNCSSCSSVRLVLLVFMVLVASLVLSWDPVIGFALRGRLGASAPRQRSHDRQSAPTGAETQMRISSSGAEDSSPVRTLRTVPSRLDGRAGEADAHPAAELGRQPERLGLLEQRGAGVRCLLAGRREGDVALGGRAGGARRLEVLDAERLRAVVRRPDRLDQRRRAAGPGRARRGSRGPAARGTPATGSGRRARGAAGAGRCRGRSGGSRRARRRRSGARGSARSARR